MMSGAIDQAGTLRSMRDQLDSAVELNMPKTRVLSITSGKGGVSEKQLLSPTLPFLWQSRARRF